METKLPHKIFLLKEKRKIDHKLSKCDQISYLWKMKFKSIFQHEIIVQPFDTEVDTGIILG